MEHRHDPEDEISLKEVLVRLKEYWVYFFSRKKFIISVAVLCATAGLLIALFTPPTYIAKTTLLLESSPSVNGMLSGALQLANQFGLAGGSSNAENQITDIITSKKVVSTALLSPVAIDGKNDLLINHYIELYELREVLDEHERTKGLTYPAADITQLNYVQDSVLNIIYKNISENILMVEKNKESGIISITVTTISEEFSISFCNQVVDAVSTFYISNITQKERTIYESIQRTVDSTQRALTVAEDRYAKWKDASNRYIKMQGQIEEIKLRRDMEILSAILAEAVKNMEIAKFNLINQTPVLQIIDQPHLALEKQKMKKKWAILVGGMIGLLLICGYLVIKKIYGDLYPSA